MTDVPILPWRATVTLARTYKRGQEASAFETVEVGFDDDGAESNIYVYVDGQEVGSLFFERNSDGRVAVTFGAFDEATQAWEPTRDHHARTADGSGLVLPSISPDAQIVRQ